MTQRRLLKLGGGMLGALVGLLLLLGLYLSLGKTLGERHTPYTPDSGFDFASGSIDDYITYTKQLMQAARLDAPSQTIINNLAPFVLEPDASCPLTASGKAERGIVLIHGLFDSPFSMRPFGEDLRSQCFYVLGLLLPDHGTRPGNILTAHWEAWAEATHFATSQLAQHADTLFVSGHSAGGTLALLEAARNPEVDALILFAPALAITPAAKLAKYLAPLGTLFPKVAWFDVSPDEAIYRYESTPLAAAAEMYELIEVTKAELAGQPRQVPVFTVASVEDNTVGTQAILTYLASNTHLRSRTLLYSEHFYPTTDRVRIVSSSTLEQQVLSVSHLGLMTPPSHSYYGYKGVYRNCGHYGTTDKPLFVQCKAGQRDYYGEATDENLALGVVERIAFNPFYESMLAAMQDFLLAPHIASTE